MAKTQVLSISLVGLLMNAQGVIQSPVVAAVPSSLVAQAPQKPLPPEVPPASQPLPPLTFGLADGTPIKLKFKEPLSSKTAKTSDPVNFEVIEAVIVGGKVVIEKGALAKGVVAEAKKARMLGRKGKLDIEIKEVTLASGERVSLRGNQESGGGLSATSIALSAVLTPLFLLMSGKNINIEAGTEFVAFVNGAYELDPAKFTATPQVK